jgi:hypothetical protein
VQGERGRLVIAGPTGAGSLEFNIDAVRIVEPSGIKTVIATEDVWDASVHLTLDFSLAWVRRCDRFLYVFTGLLRGPTHLYDFVGRYLSVRLAIGDGVLIRDLGPVCSEKPARGWAHALRVTVETYAAQRRLGLMAECADVVVEEIAACASWSKAISRRRAYNYAKARIGGHGA